MDELKRISTLPPVARLFVGLFTTLMVLVCLWAVWIYTVEKGEVEPAADDLSAEAEIDAIAVDSEAVLAPIWDTDHAGEPEPLDSARIDTMEEIGDLVEAYEGVGDDAYQEEPESRLRQNLGLAHVHVNGQTLLFFALGAVFLFTSVKPRVKKLVLMVFALAILAHAVGLSGDGFHWIFNDLLAVSGIVLVALIAYMCVMIYVDLGRARGNRK